MSTFGYNGEPTDLSKTVGVTTGYVVPSTTNDCIDQVLDLSSGKPGSNNVTMATRQKWSCEQDAALDLSCSGQQMSVDGQTAALDLTKPLLRTVQAHVTSSDQSAGVSYGGNQSQQPLHHLLGQRPAHLEGTGSTSLLKAALKSSQSDGLLQTSGQYVSSFVSGPNMIDVAARTVTASVANLTSGDVGRGPVQSFQRLFPPGSHKPVGISVPQIAHTGSPGGGAVITGVQKPIAITPPQPQNLVTPGTSAGPTRYGTVAGNQSARTNQTGNQYNSINSTHERRGQPGLVRVGENTDGRYLLHSQQEVNRLLENRKVFPLQPQIQMGTTCEMCHKTFKTKAALKLHMTVHKSMEDRQYSCNVCERRFLHHHHLVVHRRKHSGEKPFKCEECGRSFMAIFLLHKHFRTHIRESMGGKHISTLQVKKLQEKLKENPVSSSAPVETVIVSDTEDEDRSTVQPPVILNVDPTSEVTPPSASGFGLTAISGQSMEKKDFGPNDVLASHVRVPESSLDAGSSQTSGMISSCPTESAKKDTSYKVPKDSFVRQAIDNHLRACDPVSKASSLQQAASGVNSGEGFYLNEESGELVKIEQEKAVESDSELDDRKKMEALAECLLSLKANILASEQRKLAADTLSTIGMPTDTPAQAIPAASQSAERPAEGEPKVKKRRKNRNKPPEPQFEHADGAISPMTEGEHLCSQCNKRFTTEQKLYIHMSSHNSQSVPKRRGRKQTTGVRVECEVCNRKFLSQHHLFIHMGIHKAKAIKLPASKLRNRHQPLTSKLRKLGFSCLLCKKKFNFQKSLNSHMRVHKLPGKREVILTQDSCLSEVQQAFVASDPRESQCFNPGVEMKSKVVMMENPATEAKDSTSVETFADDNDEDSPVEVWNPSNIRFSEPGSPEVFMVGNMKYTRFPCHACEKKFGTKQKLKMHQLVHKDNCFLCDVCGKSFFREITLEKHINTHSMARPHSCSMCKKTFIHRSSLKRHKSSHCEVAKTSIEATPVTAVSPVDLQESMKMPIVQVKPELNIQTTDACEEVMDLSLPRKTEDLSQPPVLSPVSAPTICLDVSSSDTGASLSPPLITSEISPRHSMSSSTVTSMSTTLHDPVLPLVTVKQEPEDVSEQKPVTDAMERPASAASRVGTPSSSSSIVDAVLERRKRKTGTDGNDDKTAAGFGYPYKSRKTRVYETSCRVCKVVFPNVMGLKAHMPVHNMVETHLYECRVCHHRFTQSCSLLRHLKTSCQQNSLNCLKCGKVFQRKRSFNKHLESHRQKELSNLNGSFLDVRNDEVSPKAGSGDADLVGNESDIENNNYTDMTKAHLSQVGRPGQLRSTPPMRYNSQSRMQTQVGDSEDQHRDHAEDSGDGFIGFSSEDLSEDSEYERTSTPISSSGSAVQQALAPAYTHTLNLLSAVCSDIVNASKAEETKQMASRQEELETATLLASNLLVTAPSIEPATLPVLPGSASAELAIHPLHSSSVNTNAMQPMQTSSPSTGQPIPRSPACTMPPIPRSPAKTGPHMPSSPANRGPPIPSSPSDRGMPIPKSPAITRQPISSSPAKTGPSLQPGTSGQAYFSPVQAMSSIPVSRERVEVIEIKEEEEEEEQQIDRIPTVVREVSAETEQWKKKHDDLAQRLRANPVLLDNTTSTSHPCDTLADICSHMLAQDFSTGKTADQSDRIRAGDQNQPASGKEIKTMAQEGNQAVASVQAGKQSLVNLQEEKEPMVSCQSDVNRPIISDIEGSQPIIALHQRTHSVIDTQGNQPTATTEEPHRSVAGVHDENQSAICTVQDQPQNGDQPGQTSLLHVAVTDGQQEDEDRDNAATASPGGSVPPPLVNLFRCDLCRMLLYDKTELHVHLRNHAKSDVQAVLQELVREAKQESGSTDFQLMELLSNESNASTAELLKHEVIDLSQSRAKLLENADSSSVCSSDFSSEASSLPTTPTASKSFPSLVELRKELRNKIHARRRSQGLDDIKVEFRQPEPSELTTDERHKLDYRRECNRQAAQRSRMRKKDLVDGLLKELHKEEVVNLGLRRQVEILETEKNSLLSVFETHECVRNQTQ